MRPLKTLAAAVVAGLLFAGCSSGGEDDTAAERDAAAADTEVVDEGADGGADSSASGAEPAGGQGGEAIAAAIDPSPRHVIYNIDLVIETDDVTRAAARAAALAETSGGFVANESTEGADSATLTLRIPTDQHTTVVQDLEELGEVTHRSRTAEDVTAEVVDVEARVASQRRSIARIRELLDQAGDLADVVRIESELATREANLDSLLSRQEQLASLTTLATVTVTFYKTDTAPEDGPNAVGFMSGLRGGWDAFVATVRVIGAVAGAVLPFAAAAALIGIPGLLLWRRRRPESAEPPQPPGRPAAHPQG
ncbi:MAG TPA: DUF4349 domain-containing protein [Jiangellales bacterium]|nr:DUF4349 domain-containing protein [Jiangellales bacterium]